MFTEKMEGETTLRQRTRTPVPTLKLVSSGKRKLEEKLIEIKKKLREKFPGILFVHTDYVDETSAECSISNITLTMDDIRRLETDELQFIFKDARLVFTYTPRNGQPPVCKNESYLLYVGWFLSFVVTMGFIIFRFEDYTNILK